MASNNGGQQEDQLVGSYRISHEIGNGSFAKVYKGISIVSSYSPASSSYWLSYPSIRVLSCWRDLEPRRV